MPRPPSDLKMISVRLSAVDIATFDAIATEIGGLMNRSSVVRAFVEAARQTPAALEVFEQIVQGPGYKLPPATQKKQPEPEPEPVKPPAPGKTTKKKAKAKKSVPRQRRVR